MKIKLRIYPLLMLPLLLLPSCHNGAFLSTSEESIDVYDLDSKSVDKVKTIKARFIKNREYVPYLTLEGYASLYKDDYDSGIVSSCRKEGKKITWTVKKNNQLYFFSEIDYSKKVVSSAGSLQAALKPGEGAVDATALYYGLKMDSSAKYIGSSIFATYRFDDLDSDYFTLGGEYYMPLGFYDITYSFDAGMYYSYNYNSIYKTVDTTNYSTKKFTKDNSSITVNSEMASIVNGSSMPDYLKKYNANLFYYLLDNFYGLKEYKNITNASDYCKKVGTYDKLYSNDNSVRVQAYADTLSLLDDNHTALVSGNEAWGEEKFAIRQYGDSCLNRNKLREQLISERKSQTSSSYIDHQGILYSDDGKTAMLLFDSFVFGSSSQVFNSNGSIRGDAGKYDSFFALRKAFTTIQSRGNVKNVILDMSTNGGGVLGVMMKLLALISKTNMGTIHYLEGGSKQLAIGTAQVDSNFDSYYGVNDCYGDDFNIYLLTSDCSFSCGNAFPYFASIAGDAKIIGQKTGGGECAVGVHYLPNGEYVYHSSNIHIGYYYEQSKTFVGFESGIEPDIKINNYSDFYDINRLASYISQA